MIQQNTTVTDSQGGRTSSWGTLVTVWGELLPQGAREQLQAQAIGSHATYRFRTYMRFDVTPKMRISWTPSASWPSATAKTLEIHGVVPLNDGRIWMTLECAEVA